MGGKEWIATGALLRVDPSARSMAWRMAAATAEPVFLQLHQPKHTHSRLPLLQLAFHNFQFNGKDVLSQKRITVHPIFQLQIFTPATVVSHVAKSTDYLVAPPRSVHRLKATDPQTSASIRRSPPNTTGSALQLIRTRSSITTGAHTPT